MLRTQAAAAKAGTADIIDHESKGASLPYSAAKPHPMQSAAAFGHQVFSWPSKDLHGKTFVYGASFLFVSRVNRAYRCADAAIETFFFIDAELSELTYYHRVRGTFDLAGSAGNTFFSVYTVCHYNLPFRIEPVQILDCSRTAKTDQSSAFALL